MADKLLKGIVPAIATPFTDDNQISQEGVRKLLQCFIDAGCGGVHVCGKSGEPESLTLKEREEMTELTVEYVAGRMTIVTQAGLVTTEEGTELAKHAARAGVDAISATPPRGDCQNLSQLAEHYRIIGQATNLPFYIYWTKSQALADVTAEEFWTKMKDIPNLAGMKYADFNLFRFQRIVELSNRRLNAVTGLDEVCLAGLIMGSDGGIGSTYNIMPNLFVGIYRDFQAGRIKEAMEKQCRTNILIEALLKPEIQVYPGTRAVLNAQGIPSGKPRSPIKPTPPEGTEYLLKIIKEKNIS